jgi:hypothetical protein
VATRKTEIRNKIMRICLLNDIIVVYNGVVDDTPVLNEIKKYQLKFGFGWQILLATKVGISPQYMCDIISGRLSISEEIGAKFGFEKVWSKKKMLKKSFRRLRLQRNSIQRGFR